MNTRKLLNQKKGLILGIESNNLDTFIITRHLLTNKFSNLLNNNISELVLNKKNFVTTATMVSPKEVKTVGIHFPQFHQIPENDRFWGEGFTEWTFLKDAIRKLDIGTYNHDIRKPHADIGYYDLAEKDARKKQADLAKQYNVDIFMYYHYWFGGNKVMYKVPEAAANMEEPNLPFFVCWANEPWNKIWTGQEKHVLLAQDYGSLSDWQKHYNYLDTLFKSPLYYKLDGKPVIAIYRPADIPQLEQMLATWRKLATPTYGGLFIISSTIRNYTYPPQNVRSLFDALYLFEPHNSLNRPLHADPKTKTVHSSAVAEQIINSTRNKNQFMGVFTHWDNSPRYQKTPKLSTYHTKPDPLIFKKQLLVQLVKALMTESPNDKEDLIFISSWNECVMEPSIQDGYGFLEAHKDAKQFITKTF